MADINLIGHIGHKINTSDWSCETCSEPVLVIERNPRPMNPDDTTAEVHQKIKYLAYRAKRIKELEAE